MTNITIGVDVGGTNTDAVLLENNKVIAKYKTATTDDVTYGIAEAVKGVLNKNNYQSSQVKGE